MARLTFSSPREGRARLSGYGLLAALLGFLLMRLQAAAGAALLLAGFLVALVGLRQKDARCPSCRGWLDASSGPASSPSRECPHCGSVVP